MNDDTPQGEGAEVKRLPVKFKAPPGAEGPTLEIATAFGRGAGCNHRWTHAGLGAPLKPVSYVIREGETEVECGACATKLDPMWVLKVLAGHETQWRDAQKRYQAEMARLKDRQRTTCQHCGKMTRISRS